MNIICHSIWYYFYCIHFNSQLNENNLSFLINKSLPAYYLTASVGDGRFDYPLEKYVLRHAKTQSF